MSTRMDEKELLGYMKMYTPNDRRIKELEKKLKELDDEDGRNIKRKNKKSNTSK